MRILVIEDDREQAGWLIKGLHESGHVADHAADGEEGLTLARENVHDVLVVDRIVGSQIFTTVKIGGELSNNKGINRQGGGLSAPALTGKDM